MKVYDIIIDLSNIIVNWEDVNREYIENLVKKLGGKYEWIGDTIFITFDKASTIIKFKKEKGYITFLEEVFTE